LSRIVGSATRFESATAGVRFAARAAGGQETPAEGNPERSPFDAWSAGGLVVPLACRVIEEAGGQFTDWQGVPTIHSGEAIATNSLIHAEILAITRQFPRPQ